MDFARIIQYILFKSSGARMKFKSSSVVNAVNINKYFW